MGSEELFLCTLGPTSDFSGSAMTSIALGSQAVVCLGGPSFSRGVW